MHFHFSKNWGKPSVAVLRLSPDTTLWEIIKTIRCDGNGLSRQLGAARARAGVFCKCTWLGDCLRVIESCTTVYQSVCRGVYMFWQPLHTHVRKKSQHALKITVCPSQWDFRPFYVDDSLYFTIFLWFNFSHLQLVLRWLKLILASMVAKIDFSQPVKTMV